MRRCWVNFQCWGVLLIWIIVGQGPVALAVGAGGGCLDIFSLICPFTPISPFLWEARYRLKYFLKGPLSPKQPTNQHLKRGPVSVRGWSGGAMVLGELPVPGRPTIWMIVGLAVGQVGVVWTFLLCTIISLIFSLSMGDGPI